MRPTSRFAILVGLLVLASGCSTLRTTDPARTATEQFLLNEATRRSIEQLVALPLRDRMVFVEPNYVMGKSTGSFDGRPSDENEKLFVLAELRSRLLQQGARLTEEREKADVIVEPRVVGVGIDRIDTLFGLPAFALPAVSVQDQPLLTPELAVVKQLRQYGFASIAFVAYWREGGEIMTSSGPFVGESRREDFWIFGFKARTLGDVSPAQR